MQVKIKDKKKKKFQSFTMEITIESYDELYDLWHRSNHGLDRIRKITNKLSLKDCPFPEDDHMYDIWKILDNKLQEQNK